MSVPAEVAAMVAAAAAGPPPASSAAAAALASFSIRRHFDASSAVLLTGATGYIGSLLLEKLLRSTDVGRVYVLVRPRRGAAPAERLSRVLKGPLFHLITPEQEARVTAVAGDIMQPGLGLSPEDEAMLEENVDTVLHSAAGALLCRGAGEERGRALPP
jgi:FlaA1/EpsC-like NDP-sugar epimerase